MLGPGFLPYLVLIAVTDLRFLGVIACRRARLWRDALSASHLTDRYGSLPRPTPVSCQFWHSSSSMASGTALYTYPSSALLYSTAKGSSWCDGHRRTTKAESGLMCCSHSVAAMALIRLGGLFPRPVDMSRHAPTEGGRSHEVQQMPLFAPLAVGAKGRRGVLSMPDTA
ncbi:hypothetical protein B0T25DRAFT_181484 [Lasiosphaeria hispida]|uniref:Uncharacterized protein n=1 Tax=Lasiosphaeria hispida TaxID=260671 RepID=A0AAJ0HH04_9PEZI|nr:hypothetical protein B0T25DRAFT_181484 [Lasiosphaeria hispida]